MSTPVGVTVMCSCRGVGANVEPPVPRRIGDNANRRPATVAHNEHNGRDSHQQQCHYKAQQAPANRLGAGVGSQPAATSSCMASAAAACTTTVTTPLHGRLTCTVADATPP